MVKILYKICLFQKCTHNYVIKGIIQSLQDCLNPFTTVSYSSKNIFFKNKKLEVGPYITLNLSGLFKKSCFGLNCTVGEVLRRVLSKKLAHPLLRSFAVACLCFEKSLQMNLGQNPPTIHARYEIRGIYKTGSR